MHLISRVEGDGTNAFSSGLAISDFTMALNFLSSSTMNLSGRNLGDPAQARFCSFNGWATQVFVIQSDYWVLTIAGFTFIVLASHRRAADWMQDHGWLVAVVPWVLSIIWAFIGLVVVGYGNIGACK